MTGGGKVGGGPRSAPLRNKVEATSKSSQSGSWLMPGLALLLAYTIVFVAQLPPILGVVDEIGFLNQALLWSRPELSAEAGLRPVEDILEIDGRTVSWRNPGRSVTLLPFLSFQSTQIYALSGLFFHLLTTLLAALLLRRYGRSPIWAILVLFHPTLSLYSRTLMADGPAATFILLGILVLERHRGGAFAAGLAFGIAAVFRYHAGILLVTLAGELFAGRRGPDRWRHAGACLAGGGIIGLGIVLYNLHAYGRPLGFTGQGFWKPDSIAVNGPAYLTALALFWPLMILAPFFHRRPGRGPLWAAVLTLLVTMLGYSWHDRGTGNLQTHILSLRLMQPVLPLWIIAYADILEERLGPVFVRITSARLRKAALLAFCVLMLAGQGAIFHRHQQHLQDLKRAREEISALVPDGSLVVGNSTVRKLFAELGAPTPVYQWLPYDLAGVIQDLGPQLEAHHDEWYLAVLPKRPGFEFPGILARYVRTYRPEIIETEAPGLILYLVEGRDPGHPPPSPPSESETGATDRLRGLRSSRE